MSNIHHLGELIETIYLIYFSCLVIDKTLTMKYSDPSGILAPDMSIHSRRSCAHESESTMTHIEVEKERLEKKLGWANYCNLGTFILKMKFDEMKLHHNLDAVEGIGAHGSSCSNP